MDNAHQTIEFFGLSIELHEIVSLLQKQMQLKEVCQQILYQRIIEQTAQAQGLVVTLEEIEAERERLRRETLAKDADTQAWLGNQMIALEDWQVCIGSRLLSQKLAEYLFAKEVEKFFEQNKNEFEQVLIYQVVVPQAEIAREILYQLEEKEISFYEAAHLYDLDEKRRHLCGYEGKLYRWDLQPDIAAVLFSSVLGEVIGPIQTGVGHHLLMVEEFIPAELTLQRYQDILHRMFQRWLAMELNYLLQSGTI